MPRGKNTISKKSDPKTKTPREKVKKLVPPAMVKEEDVVEEESDDAAEGFAPKEKVPVVLEIEERDDIVTPIDKLVADPLLDAASIEGADPDELIDEEEIDPFGDKWEA